MPSAERNAKAKAARTVGGVPVPDGDIHVPYALTDQAVDERNQRPGRVSQIARITRDPDFDQQLAQLDDELEMGADPMREIAEQAKAVNPEYSFRYLSDKVVARRGLRGWVPVIKRNGDPVKCGSMTLAAMPQEFGAIRNEKYRREGADAFVSAQQNLIASQEKAIAEAGVAGIAPLVSSDSLRDADHPKRSLSVGVQSSRG